MTTIPAFFLFLPLAGYVIIALSDFHLERNAYAIYDLARHSVAALLLNNKINIKNNLVLIHFNFLLSSFGAPWYTLRENMVRPLSLILEAKIWQRLAKGPTGEHDQCHYLWSSATVCYSNEDFHMIDSSLAQLGQCVTEARYIALGESCDIQYSSSIGNRYYQARLKIKRQKIFIILEK